MAKITTSKIEEMIRNKMKEKGIPETEMNEELIEKIKNKIKSAIPPKTAPSIPEKEKNVVVDVSQNMPTETPGTIPSPITKTSEEDVETKEVAKKEGELSQKEQEITDREVKLQQKEIELAQKEQELAYKPELPKFFDQIGSEQMFVFNMDELSLGAESLSQTPLRIVANPDEKKSMNDIWLEKGKREAEIYMVKFEKVGNINFDPFEGTSKFEEKRFEEAPLPQTNEPANIQEPPKSDLVDSIEPIKDVTLPLSTNNDMGLNAIDTERILKDKVEEILKAYFINKQ